MLGLFGELWPYQRVSLCILLLSLLPPQFLLSTPASVLCLIHRLFWVGGAKQAVTWYAIAPFTELGSGMAVVLTGSGERLPHTLWLLRHMLDTYAASCCILDQPWLRHKSTIACNLNMLKLQLACCWQNILGSAAMNKSCFLFEFLQVASPSYGDITTPIQKYRSISADARALMQRRYWLCLTRADELEFILKYSHCYVCNIYLFATCLKLY